MKRVIIILTLLSMVFGFTAFDCSSTELTSARLYIQQKNLKKAKESLLKEIKKNPKSDEGYYLLGFVNGEEGDVNGMLNNFDKSLSISKKFEKQIDDSKKYHWGNSFNKGVAYFNRAAKQANKDSAKAIFMTSIKNFENAVSIEPDSSASYKNLAYAYLNVGMTDKAMTTVEKLNELTHSADSYSLLGDLYAREGQKLMSVFKSTGNQEDSVKAMNVFDKEVKLLEEGRKKYPDNTDILMELSNAYIASNKIEVAKEAFKAGVAKEPNNKYYRYNYGSLLLNAKDYASAVEQLTKAVEIDSTYENAIYNLGVTYIKWGADIRDKAAAEDKQDDSYKEKFQKALPYMQKYLEFHPDDPTIWDLLGRIYANLGMTDKSKEAFNKADQYKNK